MTQKKPKLGVLALMLEDYLPLFPGIDRAQTAYVNEVLDGLRDAAEFVFPHAAMNRAQIESLVAQYNHEKLDGILILLLTYSQGAYLVRALEENHLPLALALIQPEQTVRPDFIEWDYTVNQGIHGSQDQANVMTRMGVNCVYYAGNRCDGSFVRFVADFGRAAMTVRAMKRMRIGVIGKLPGMGDVITDDMAIYRFLGPELVYDSIGTVRRFCAEVEEDAVRAQMDADRAVFELDPTLDEPTHAEAARMYLGLRAACPAIRCTTANAARMAVLRSCRCLRRQTCWPTAMATPPRAIRPPPCWWRPCRRSAARRALRKCT